MSRHIDRWVMVAMVAASAVSAAACGDDGAAGEGAGEEASLRTEDGYEVVSAERTKAPVTATKQGARAARDRDRLILEPNTPDPEAGDFTLEEAVAEMPLDGQLVVELATDLGTIFCDLYADRVPRTVAAFIGLTRGKRTWWSPEAGQWETRPYYRGTSFHRVIPDYLIQAGDQLGDGTGDVGFDIPLERHDTLRFDQAGMLGMVTGTGEEGGAGQFFITDGAAPQLDGQYTVFGKCTPVNVVERIARVPQGGGPDHRPLTEVLISRTFIQRVPGGSANARMTTPAVRPENQGQPRGASTGPSEMRHEMEELLRRRQQRLEKQP